MPESEPSHGAVPWFPSKACHPRNGASEVDSANVGEVRFTVCA